MMDSQIAVFLSVPKSEFNFAGFCCTIKVVSLNQNQDRADLDLGLYWWDIFSSLTHISHLLLPEGEVRGASCPKLFVLLLIFWAKNMPDLAIKKWFINTQHTKNYKNNHNFFF